MCSKLRALEVHFSSMPAEMLVFIVNGSFSDSSGKDCAAGMLMGLGGRNAGAVGVPSAASESLHRKEARGPNELRVRAGRMLVEDARAREAGGGTSAPAVVDGMGIGRCLESNKM